MERARPAGRVRTFTPEEANALVPRLRPLLAKLREAYHEMSFAREQWREALAFEGAGEEAARWEERAAARAAEVRALVEELEALGAQVKDPTLGLVDLPGLRRDGTPVLLCYRDDEDAIRFWHPLEGGYAARRSLADL